MVNIFGIYFGLQLHITLVNLFNAVLVMTIKPPIGLTPYRFWLEKYPNPTPQELLQRRRELDAAITRYKAVDRPIPIHWTTR